MVVFEPQPKQQEFIDAVFSNKYSFLVFGGAMGGGKSYVSVAILILLAKIYPGSIWCIIRESLPVMKNTVIPTFKKICPKNFIVSYNQSEQKVHFTNGSQIWFMAEDYANDKDFDRFKGLEVNGFLLEQIEELQEGLLDICVIRAGRHKIEPMPKPLILATVNPTMNWVKKKIYTPWLQNTLPKGWYYLPSTIEDNPALSEDREYIERFDNLDPITRRRYIQGDWTAFKIEGQILYCFDHGKHVRGLKHEPNPHLDLWISFDFNVNPMTCTIAQRPTLKNPIIIDEIRLENSHTEELCKHILAKYPGFKYMVTGDASGTKRSTTTGGGITDWHIIVKTLKLKDFQIKKRKANLPLNDSITICNAILYHLNLQITHNCEGLIADVTYAVADEYGKPKKDSTTSGLHFFDCFDGETNIQTYLGEIPIKNIQNGDLVLTSNGYVEVIDHWSSVAQTYEFVFSDGRSVICTKDHLFYTCDFGYLPIFDIFTRNIKVCILNTADQSTTETSEGITLRINLTLAHFIGKYGLTTTVKYLRDTTSITLMKIKTTIVQKTLALLRHPIIKAITPKSAYQRIQNITSGFKKSESFMLQNGIDRKRGVSGIREISKEDLEKNLLIGNMSAICADVNTYPEQRIQAVQDSVPITVNQLTGEQKELIMKKENVSGAEVGLLLTNTTKQPRAQGHAQITVCGMRDAGVRIVYDITVKDKNEFYANGILVHNCFRYSLDAMYPDFITNPKKYQ